MKNKLIILVAVIFLVIGLLMGYFLKAKVFKDEINCPKCVEIEPVIKEYLSYKDKKVYLYNLNELNLTVDDQEITLKDYIANFNSYEEAFTNLEEELDLQKTLKDGGTKIYNVKKNSSLIKKDDLTVISCNTTDGNKDIYFGINLNTVEAFDMGVCDKHFFTDVNFTRVYTISKITILDTQEEDNTKKYDLEITISDDKGKSTKIERIMSEESKNILKEQEKFTFYFTNKYKEHIKDDIEYIFANCTLTGVVPYGK